MEYIYIILLEYIYITLLLPCTISFFFTPKIISNILSFIQTMVFKNTGKDILRGYSPAQIHVIIEIYHLIFMFIIYTVYFIHHGFLYIIYPFYMISGPLILFPLILLFMMYKEFYIHFALIFRIRYYMFLINYHNTYKIKKGLEKFLNFYFKYCTKIDSNKTNLLIIYTHLSMHCFNIDLISEAYEYNEKAFAIVKEKKNSENEYIQLYLIKSSIFSCWGKEEIALQILNDKYNKYKNLITKREEIMMLLEIGRLYIDLLDIETGMDCLDIAYQKTKLIRYEPGILNTIFYGFSNYFLYTRQPDRAIYYCKSGISLNKNTKEAYKEIYFVQNLAFANMQKKKMRIALDYLITAFELYQKFEKSHQNNSLLIDLCAYLGYIYYSFKEKNKSKLYLEKGIKILQNNKNDVSGHFLMAICGDIEFEQNNWEKSIYFYKESIKIIEILQTRINRYYYRELYMASNITPYSRLVLAYIKINKYSQAIEIVERVKTCSLVQMLFSKNLYPKGNISKKIIKELDKQRKNIIYLEKKKQLSTNQMFGSSFNIINSKPQERFFEQQKREREWYESKEQLQVLLDEIKLKDPNFNYTQRVESIDVQKIQSLIKENTVIIQWYIVEDEIITFILDKSNINILRSDKIKVEKLKKWVDKYLQSIHQLGYKQKHFLEDLSIYLLELSKILQIEQVLNLIPLSCQELILIPYRYLHLLPLHALIITSQMEKNLFKRFPLGIKYLPSCQVFELVQKMKRPTFNNFIAIKNPTKELIYANLQVDIVSKYFKSQRILTGETSIKEIFLEQKNLTESHCLHFACHGKFNEESPLESYLKVGHQEFITLEEIFKLNLEQCRLVVLSACETGLTDHNSITDEYVGLPNGFIYAGASNVVSTLWKVDQLATAFLMIKFYENLEKNSQVRTGQVAIALQDAQRWLRDLTVSEFEQCLNLFQPQIKKILNTIPHSGKRKIFEISLQKVRERKPRPFENPFYWAGFIAIGL